MLAHQHRKQLQEPPLLLHQTLDHYQNAKGDNQERIDTLQELISAAMAFKPDEVVLDEWASPETATLPLVAFLSNASLEAGERQAKPAGCPGDDGQV